MRGAWGIGGVALGLFAAACGDPEGVGSFELEGPPKVAIGAPFELAIVAVGTSGTRPLASFSGEVELSVSAGAIAPARATLVGGVGAVRVTLSGAVGPLEIRATHGARTGAQAVLVEGSGRLVGPAGSLAGPAVPLLRFRARPESYRSDHPDAPGLPIAVDTLALAFRADATIADANAALARVGAEIVGGVPGRADAPGLLFLRLPTADHAALAVHLADLRQDPAVLRVVPDALLAPLVAPPPNAGDPPYWTWARSPAGQNWGLELISAPALWNLNGGLARVNAPGRVGVLDVGFAVGHEDLELDERLPPETLAVHGTHVAGIVGARFGNGLGVDGVRPFARIVASGPSFSIGSDGVELRLSWGEEMMLYLLDLAADRPDVRVVNISLGYNWSHLGLDPATFPYLAWMVAEQGELLGLVTVLWSWSHPVPAVVVAAGNDSDAGLGTIDARWASPFAYAGLALGLPNVFVIEALELAIGGPGDATRAPFSNVGGDLSAPGVDIASASWADEEGSAYAELSGTSMAAPHVTGLVSVLYGLAPALTFEQLREVLVETAVPVAGGAAPRIDAFAAALDLDRLEGGHRILDLLCDTDDGTLDGNQRVDPLDGAPVSTEDADGDGLEGDGKVDMRDFRRFRDAFLAVSGEQIALDGAADHPKRDLDRDGRVTEFEGDLARFDFNGDGKLGRLDRRALPGALGGAEVTDLDVFKVAFADPTVEKDALFQLMFGGDVDLWPRRCLSVPGAARVRTTLTPKGAIHPVPIERLHTAEVPRAIVTVPSGGQGFALVAVAEDDAGTALARAEASLLLRPGEDLFLDPECETDTPGWATLLTLAGAGYDAAEGITPTRDGGAIAFGSAQSAGAGAEDLYLARLEPGGAVAWARVYGGEGREVAHAVAERLDGRLVVVGETWSSSERYSDAWILELGPDGALLDQRALGGDEVDVVTRVLLTDDGGLVLGGHTGSFTSASCGPLRCTDAWIVRLGPNGALSWSFVFGGDGAEYIRALVPTEGGLIVVGDTQSIGVGGRDVFVLALDEVGAAASLRVYGTGGDDLPKVAVGSGGGLAIFGHTTQGPTQGFGLWLDGAGAVTRSLGFTYGSGLLVEDAVALPLGGWLVAGTVCGASDADAFAAELSSSGALTWAGAYEVTEGDTERGEGVALTSGGPVLAGMGSWSQPTNGDPLLLGLGEGGELGCGIDRALAIDVAPRVVVSGPGDLARRAVSPFVVPTSAVSEPAAQSVEWRCGP